MSRQSQDAQVALQAKQQIAHNAKVASGKTAPRDPNTPEARTKKITQAKRAEQKAADANAATLAVRKAKTPTPAPKPKATGSGALVGVAKGATEGQPHTKRAVEEARKRLQPHAQRDAAIKQLEALTTEAQANPLQVAGTLFETAKQAANKRREVRALLQPFLDMKPAPGPTKAKSTPAKTPKAKAEPKATQTITILDKAFTFGAEGTSRNASWKACLASKTTADYAAKGGAAKYLTRWVAAKAIKLS